VKNAWKYIEFHIRYSRVLDTEMFAGHVCFLHPSHLGLSQGRSVWLIISICTVVLPSSRRSSIIEIIKDALAFRDTQAKPKIRLCT